MADDRCIHGMLNNQCSLCRGDEDPVKHVPASDLNAGALFDYAAAHPSFSSAQAMQDLEFSTSQFHDAVRALRHILASDNINLVCDTTSHTWQYRLVGTLDEAMPWATIRLRAIESHLQTVVVVTQSIVGATSPKSREGRKARLIAQQIGLLHMQLEMLDIQ